MAPPSGRRRTRSETEDDDSDAERYGTPSEPADSPKRARLESDSETDSANDGPRTNGRPVNGNAGTNGNISAEDYQPGAIVRVTVENFVTYEKAEFFPGPNLNMVIGPNGTGKSSLVCAICLGLGYSPKHLGRAGSVKEFVKHGKDTATIEIELQKKPKDRSNYVIRVVIRREQNNQKWWLNGKESTHKAIQALMRSLKIQVDNLCQFLPQDRVVEFAACTPIDLLHETLRAAAPEQMLQWQKQLQDLHRDKKGLTEASQADVATLQNLESRQQGLQADVDRLREREEIQQRVGNLRSALVLAKYQQARDNHNQAKERRKEAERALKRLEQESGPSLEAVNRKQEYAQQVEAAVSGRTQALSGILREAEELGKEAHRASEDIKEFENRQDSERKGFDERKKEVAMSRSKITALQADLKNRPSEFNAADWNQKIRAEEHTLRELEAEQREISTQTDGIRTQGKATMVELDRLKKDIDSFDTQQGQQLNFMKKHFPELATGWEWVQANQNMFEKEILGPPMVSCSVKDERYSNQIQSLLQVDDFSCFTAQTKNDYKKLTDQLYRVMSLSVVIRNCSKSLQEFGRPVDRSETAALGLDGFAIDYLEGPEPVLAMLCAEKRLNQSGVSLEDHGDAQYDRLVSNGRVNSWAAGKQSYTIRRRKEYGPQAMTTITKPIQPGRFWTDQPVDSQEKAELSRRLAEVNGEKNMLKEQLNELKGKDETIEEQKTGLLDKIEELKREKSALQREFHKWQSLPDKIESEERLKAASEKAMREARKNLNDLRYECDSATIERAKLVLRHKDAVAKIRDAHRAVLEAQIRHIEARSDVSGLKDRSSSIMERLDQEKQNVQEALGEAERTRDAGRQLGTQVQELLAQHPDKSEEFSRLCENKGPEEVEMEIEAEAANLELIHAANPNVIREFERRAQEIERLSHKMAGLNQKLAGLDAQLEEIMAKWEPQLDELVSKINDAFAYNFEQISCAGEIRVHKDPDFDLWAMDIMVRFRENETLQQLTAHRQSGGERAVSTIFYLMALQSMAQSPFRVVDEINQGMDPRNERMVHERMVEIACREHTSQYFLITPKLLTGLRYDPKMRVLCIASGEHMPREGRKLDFARCLRVQKGLMAGA